MAHRRVFPVHEMGSSLLKYSHTAIRNFLPWVTPLFPLLILAGYSLLYYLQREMWRGDVGLWHWTGGVLLVLGMLWFSVHACMCFFAPGPIKGAVRGALLLSVGAYVICIFIAEQAFPVKNMVPAKRAMSQAGYRLVQKNLQRQLQRRSTRLIKQIRGVTTKRETNRFGWAGKDRMFNSSNKRIVFIGDSFLMIRSSRNLAELVEDRLRLQDKNTDVINLSLDSTDMNDYRYRFYEFAFDYNPDHIMIFIYGANDLDTRYTYNKYKHPVYSVTSEAILFLDMNEDLPKKVLHLLGELQEDSIVFRDKNSFLEYLRPFGLSTEQASLVYLTVFAYSGFYSDSFPMERLAPHTLTRLTNLWKALVPGRAGESDQWISLQPEYEKVFTLPKEERLDRIAELAARYNNSPSKEPYLRKLRKLPSQFLDELLEEPDVTYYFWPAITKLVLDYPKENRVFHRRINAVADNYAKLMEEFRREAELRGVKLTIVLIPEASQVDDDFLQFWNPLINFRELMAAKHTLLQTLGNKLQSTTPTLPLLDYRSELSGAYWHFDGHWNEQGNAAAADIISGYLSK